jgi:hypothetical protein
MAAIGQERTPSSLQVDCLNPFPNAICLLALGTGVVTIRTASDPWQG